MNFVDAFDRKFAYVFGLIGASAVAFLAQMTALKSIGGRTTKSESNYYSSLGRIQSGVTIKPQVMLLGSSMTGRLPDNSDGFTGVANLGCDGASAVDTIRAIDEGRLPMAPILVVEGNTLILGSNSQESEIASAMKAPWFNVGVRLPCFSATARPSAFLYSELLENRTGQAEGPDGQLLPGEYHFGVVANEVELDKDCQQLAAELTARFLRMRERGVQVFIVMLPPGPQVGSRNMNLARQLSFLGRVPFLDLNEGLPPGAITLTDGVHMDSPSAAAVIRTVLSELPRP